MHSENNHLRLQLQHQSRHDLSQRDMEIAEALAAVACRTPCPGVLAGSAVCSESSIGAYTILATIFDIEYLSQYHNFDCGCALLNHGVADTKRLNLGNLNPIYERELTKLELHIISIDSAILCSSGA